MDFHYLLRILAGRKWLIATVAIAAAALAFYKVGRKPPVYKAEVIVSTGIVNYKGFNSDNKDAFVQEFQIQNSFSNLTEFCQSRSSIKLLTIKLLQHDLMLAGGSSKEPFRESNRSLSNFTDDEMTELRATLGQVNFDSIIDPTLSARADLLLDKISRAYGYDHDQLRNSLEIKRMGETDYLRVSFRTNEAKLAHFAANSYVQEFMTYYQNLRLIRNRSDVAFYQKLTGEKKVAIDSMKRKLDGYKIAKALPRLDEGGKSLYQQITQLELDLADATRSKQSSTEAKNKLEGYLNQGDRKLVNERQDRVISKYNSSDLNEKVNRLSQTSIKSGRKDPKLEAELKAAQAELSQAIAAESRDLHRTRLDEKTNREDDVFKKKIDADLDFVNADNAVKTIDSKLGVLKGKLSSLVEDDAFTNGISTDLDRAEDEFTNLNNKLNESRLSLESSRNPLTIIENAQFPEWPEPNQRKLIAVFSGIAAGTLTTMLIFFLAFFDNALRSPLVFQKAVAGLPLLGAINRVNLKRLDLNEIFTSNVVAMKGHDVFRESLRKMRMLLEGSGGKIFLVTSAKEGEGKSFTINALAHSLAANSKNVLILDTNFKNPTLTSFAHEPTRFAAILNRQLMDYELENVFLKKNPSPQFQSMVVDVLGNKRPDRSPAELFSGKNFRRFLDELSAAYDFILLDSPALNQFADARELAAYADKVVAIFSASTSISIADRESIDWLERLGKKYAGSLLNQVDLKNMN